MTREEALQILDTILTIGEQVDALEMAIQALEQEPCEKCKYYDGNSCQHYDYKVGYTQGYEDASNRFRQEPCDDAISRILKRMWNFRGKHTTSIDKVAMEQIIRDELTSVTQKPIECDDAISRREALKCLNGAWGDYSVLNEVFERIDKLPSVTQKSGKWDRSCTCSVCGQWRILESEKNGGKYKYCPNCGCRMVEPQESEE